MRRILSFNCEGAVLAATLDDALGTTGVLIVSGGNEIRFGAHRGMAKLSAVIAAAGYPVLRFDRRGIGDSEGDNGGFESSAADIAAALFAFKRECPAVSRVIAFGNCDAASALLLHRPAVDALILANPWVFEPADDLPPPAAIRARYAEKLRDPTALRRLLTGAVSFRKLFAGIASIAKPTSASSLAERVAAGMAATTAPISILLATGDATAIAFSDQWEKPTFAAQRRRHDVTVKRIESSSHSFASDADYQALKAAILASCS